MYQLAGLTRRGRLMLFALLHSGFVSAATVNPPVLEAYTLAVTGQVGVFSVPYELQGAPLPLDNKPRRLAKTDWLKGKLPVDRSPRVRDAGHPAGAPLTAQTTRPQTAPAAPVPSALWILGVAMIGLSAVGRRRAQPTAPSAA